MPQAQAYSSCPRGVTSMDLVVRTMSREPNSSSSCRMWVLTVGWERYSFSAARVMLLC